MIRKKLLALGISAVAVTAVAGAGFAGWTFETTKTERTDLGVKVTAAYSFGTLTIDTGAPDTVVLDEAGVSLEKSSSAVTNLEASWTINTDSYTNAVAKLTYTVSVYIKDGVSPNNGLSYYVNCGSTTAETTSDETGYTQYNFIIKPGTSDITEDTGANTTTVKLSLANPLKYIEANKPKTLDAYKTMVTDVTGKTSPVVDTEYSSTATDMVIVKFTVSKTTT